MDGGSRWGIKGSNELADGLSAIYRFEHRINTANAGLDGGGRLAHVGLSGGFGTLTLGQIWSASFNATGAITDNSLLWGDSATSYRVGNALSYSNSVGNASLQIDAIMDNERDTGDAVDQIEFGMTIGLGDIGKVAVGYVESKDTNIDDAWVHMPGDDPTPGQTAIAPVDPTFWLWGDDVAAGEMRGRTMLTEVTVMVPITPGTANVYYNADGTYRTADTGNSIVRGEISILNDIRAVIDPNDLSVTYVVGEADDGTIAACEAPATCEEETVYVQTSTAFGTGTALTADGVAADTADGNTQAYIVRENSITTDTFHFVVTNPGDAEGLIRDTGAEVAGQLGMDEGNPGRPASVYDPGTPDGVEEDGAPNIDPGFKATHIAVEFGLGGVTAWLGHSKIENNGGALVMPEMAPATGDVVRDEDDELMRTMDSDTKVTHAGVRGSVGDGGINYYLAYRSVDAAGEKSNPFLINLNQSLGDGATAFIEHANDDDGESGRTWVGLKVDF